MREEKWTEYFPPNLLNTNDFQNDRFIGPSVWPEHRWAPLTAAGERIRQRDLDGLLTIDDDDDDDSH